jgi:sugar phosphate isomerase/epimerase
MLRVKGGVNAMIDIKRGVSLYSYQHEYFLRRMTLEDCIKAVSDLGADGVELLGEQMLPNFPCPDDEFVAKWNYWMQKYNTKPTCFDAFIDWKMYRNRILSDDECADIMARDMRLAHKLGFKTFRAIAVTPLKAFEKCLPLAEALDLQLTVEIHSPLKIDSEWFTERVEFIEKHNTKYFGFVPDMSIFVEQVPEYKADAAIESGATEKIVRYINEAYKNRAKKETTLEEINKMNANDLDRAWLNNAFHYSYADPKELIKVIPYTNHIHAKFYKMGEDCLDTSINYPEIVNVLAQNGFKGYLSSEYEGQQVGILDSVEQVRRQHTLLKNILKNY